MILGIYGAGGLGRELYDVAVRRNAESFHWQQIVFIDDFCKECDYFSTKIFRLDSLATDKNEYECVIAVGEPSLREKLFWKLQNYKIKMTCLIDPTAIVSPTAKINAGSIICEYTSVHAGVELGYNTLIQPYCCVGHDIKVGNHAVLSSYSSPGGGVILGARVFLGMHASIMECVSIGDDAIIGMGAAVFRDVPARATVIGNPARITKGNDDHRVFMANDRKRE